MVIRNTKWSPTGADSHTGNDKCRAYSPDIHRLGYWICDIGPWRSV